MPQHVNLLAARFRNDADFMVDIIKEEVQEYDSDLAKIGDFVSGLQKLVVPYKDFNYRYFNRQTLRCSLMRQRCWQSNQWQDQDHLWLLAGSHLPLTLEKLSFSPFIEAVLLLEPVTVIELALKSFLIFFSVYVVYYTSIDDMLG